MERARIEGTRKVPVEVIVNGYPIAQQEILADGELRDIAFEVPIQYSSWIAPRILPSSHTNPVLWSWMVSPSGLTSVVPSGVLPG